MDGWEVVGKLAAVSAIGYVFYLMADNWVQFKASEEAYKVFKERFSWPQLDGMRKEVDELKADMAVLRKYGKL